MISEIVRNTIKKYDLIKKRDHLLIGVSGGPDSVALLYLLDSLSEEMGFNLHIAHLDHMLRRDSGKDAAFVSSLGKKLNISVTLGKSNLKKLLQNGSLEEIARNARFNFLFKTAKSIKADKIVLAHNLDDQAETVLMRILRGTGLHGLCAISPKKNIQGFEIIRPLIGVKRKDIERYIKKIGVKARRDKTNLQDIFFRNKIRNRLIPLLEKQYSPGIKDLLSNLAESASLDYDYLNYQAMRLAGTRGKSLKLRRYLKLHPAMQRLLLRLYIAKLQGSTRRISFKHIKEIEDLVIARPVNSVVDLPKGISVVKKAKTLVFYRR